MRFWQDVARRRSIGAMLVAVAVAGGGNEPAARAQTTAGQAPTAQAQANPSSPNRAPATQRLPQPGRAAAGSRPDAQAAAQPGANSRVPIGGGQIAPAPGAARGAGAPPPAPTAPFQLTAREQEQLEKTLARWEEQNSKTKTFKCKFKRWEYDNELTDDQAKDHCRSVGAGEVKYKQPDHGSFEIKELTEFNGNDHKYEKRGIADGLDHWVCDGTAIYEFVPADKKLKVHPLPKEMQGEAIADGPIPFIFGAKVDKMKQRYWIHDITPKEEISQRLWLEVFPKYQHDAVNFSSAILVLTAPDFSL
ncbi:MAG TPA: TIGR03009 domain-containing protein, partial [Pirellulales bacterium]